MIRIIVCESDPEKTEVIRSQLQRYAGPLSQEVQVYWLSGSERKTYAAEYAGQAQIAIVSMELEDGLEIAKTIHRKNSLCRLILHSGSCMELENWIPAGPVSFPRSLMQLAAELERLTEELMLDGNLFVFSFQREKVIVPYSDIVYFQSSLRYAEVFARDRNLGRFPGKLDDIEEKAPKDLFLRIHQSYLVNRKCVTGLDYTTHELILLREVRLPISAKYYRQVCEWLPKN